MHEENIQYIRQYLRENAQFPIEQLVTTLQAAGYHAEDIMAARAPETEAENSHSDADTLTGSLGSEQFSQSDGSSAPEQRMSETPSVEVLQPKRISRFPKSLIWWGAGLAGVIALALAVYAFVFVRMPASNVPDQDAPAMDDQAAVTPGEDQADSMMAEKENMTGDILAPFGKSFHEGDFKIVVRGNDATAPDVLKEYTLYTQKGTVVRAEFASIPNRASIMKNNKVFEIDTAKKDFYEYTADTDQAQEIFDRATTDIDALEMLTKQSFSGDISWNARPGLTYVNSSDEGAETIRVILDPVTQMVSEMSVRSSQDAAWHTVSFTFSPSSDVEALMRFPLDYKKENSQMGS